ncbi:hypothetical protein ACHAWO_008911 [Cyclotella atomus]|jgi:hypothetical protein|uniref:Uncharacterized protein n=1 Tax=Cyclotella atomus TaxID=382360 RepID=A0ABD3NGI9_9STRA
MMTGANFRINTPAIRRAILAHRCRRETDQIKALQESINFHRSLLYLLPRDFPPVSFQDLDPKSHVGNEETEEPHRLTEKEMALERKATIQQLRDELAELKRRVDDKHQREKAKIQAENIKTQVHSPVSAPISPTQSVLSLESEPQPLLNSLFESLNTSPRSVQDMDGHHMPSFLNIRRDHSR